MVHDPSQDTRLTNPITGGGFDTPQAAALIIVVAFVLLVLIRRGFRGVNLAGIHVGVS